MVHLVLKGNPKSTSTIYHYHCKFGTPSGYMTADGKTLKTDYQWQAKSQWKRKILTGDIEVIIRLYFGTKRKCDWDNFHKLSMDALTGIVWADDSQIQRATVEKFYDKNSPRIEIEVYDLST